MGYRRYPGALSVLIESEPGSDLFFDAFSSREPVSTSLENALDQRPSVPPLAPLLLPAGAFLFSDDRASQQKRHLSGS